MSSFADVHRNFTANEEYCLTHPTGQDHIACQGCMDPATNKWRTTSGWDVVQKNLRTMRFQEMVTLTLASFLIGAAVAKDVYDVMHCKTLRLELLKDVPAEERTWHATALSALNVLRQFTLIPTVVLNINQMVLYVGADAMTICFNTLALIFLVRTSFLARLVSASCPAISPCLMTQLECDNVAFTVLSQENMVGPKRVKFSDNKEAMAQKLRTAYVLGITIIVPFSLIVCPRNGVGLPVMDWPGTFLVAFALLGAAFQEVAMSEAEGSEEPLTKQKIGLQFMGGFGMFPTILLGNLWLSHGFQPVIDGLHCMFGIDPPGNWPGHDATGMYGASTNDHPIEWGLLGR